MFGVGDVYLDGYGVRFLLRRPYFLLKSLPRGLGSDSPEAEPEAGIWEHAV